MGKGDLEATKSLGDEGEQRMSSPAYAALIGQEILVVTMNDIPNWKIVEIVGPVYGVSVRSRNIGANLAAGFKSLVGGELKTVTKVTFDSRTEAIQRMEKNAKEIGANAVIAFRFDASEWSSTMAMCITAYGTAVKAIKIGDNSQG